MKKGNVEVHRNRCHMFNALYTNLVGVETLESPFNGIGSSNVLCGKGFKFIQVSSSSYTHPVNQCLPTVG